MYHPAIARETARGIATSAAIAARFQKSFVSRPQGGQNRQTKETQTSGKECIHPQSRQTTDPSPRDTKCYETGHDRIVWEKRRMIVTILEDYKLFIPPSYGLF
jgi:hypothetical protein